MPDGRVVVTAFAKAGKGGAVNRQRRSHAFVSMTNAAPGENDLTISLCKSRVIGKRATFTKQDAAEPPTCQQCWRRVQDLLQEGFA